MGEVNDLHRLSSLRSLRRVADQMGGSRPCLHRGSLHRPERMVKKSRDEKVELLLRPVLGHDSGCVLNFETCGVRSRRNSSNGSFWNLVFLQTFRSPAKFQYIAAISALTSSRLKTTGNVRGTNTGFIFAINSLRSSVTSKKNFNPVIGCLITLSQSIKTSRAQPVASI